MYMRYQAVVTTPCMQDLGTGRCAKDANGPRIRTAGFCEVSRWAPAASYYSVEVMRVLVQTLPRC